MKNIKKFLKQNKINSYLICDFNGNAKNGRNILNFEAYTARRWFCFIRDDGNIDWIVSELESSHFDGVKGIKHLYKTHEEMKSILTEILNSCSRIAIDISESNEIPGMDLIPAGLFELLKTLSEATEFISSADLLQFLNSQKIQKNIQTHFEAAENLKLIFFESVELIKLNISQNIKITDFDIRQFIMTKYKQLNMIVDEDLCVVATNERTADPHYLPTKNNNHVIEKNSLILIDIWAKQNIKDAIFADSTFIAWIGPEDIPEEILNVWDIVSGARNAGVDFINQNYKSGIRGFEVDEVVRRHIDGRGFGQNFIHRTGHSIDISDHGKGANIDNFEIRDSRNLLPGSLFSIEPGIYLKNKFGIRSEINVFIDENLIPTVTTLKQESILII